MPATTWKILNKNSPGTASTFAADDWDVPGRYMHDIDFSATDPSSIKTNTSFWDNRLRFWNPAKTFSYRLRTLAILANYDITLPLITSNDEFEMLLAAQTPQNKTINLANNILTSTAASAGGIPSHNGTKYVNKAVGSAGQVPTVNAGGTDWTWAAPTASNIADNAVTTAKILDSAVTNAKLAGSIQGIKLLDNSITDAKLTQITDKTKLPSDINYTNPIERHIGWFNPTHATAHNGIFNGICVAAAGQTFSANSLSGGLLANFTTGAVSGNQAGFRTNQNVVEIAHDFSLSFRFAINQTTATRLFIGVVNDAGAFRSGADPLNAKSGVGLWVDSAANGNFRIAKNEGTGATDVGDFGTAIPLDTSTHTVKMTANSGVPRIEWLVDAQALHNSLSSLPANTTEMALQVYVETSATATKAFDLRYLVLDGPTP